MTAVETFSAMTTGIMTYKSRNELNYHHISAVKSSNLCQSVHIPSVIHFRFSTVQ